jgi:hypothetical protein
VVLVADWFADGTDAIGLLGIVAVGLPNSIRLVSTEGGVVPSTGDLIIINNNPITPRIANPIATMVKIREESSLRGSDAERTCNRAEEPRVTARFIDEEGGRIRTELLDGFLAGGILAGGTGGG